MAAQKVGPSGTVVLFDLSEGMLAVARQKTAKAGVRDQVKFTAGDILYSPFADNSFDVVLATYSLCPLDDPVKGVTELYRVTRPGGRIGVAHSTDPDIPVLRWSANKIQRVVWHIPSISLGCRSVSLLPTLEQAGGSVMSKKQIGVPLWPFWVFVVEKPATALGRGVM